MLKKVVTLIQLNSVQVLLILGIINSAMAQQEVHWAIALAVNVVGTIVGMIARARPQPEVAEKLSRL